MKNIYYRDQNQGGTTSRVRSQVKCDLYREEKNYYSLNLVGFSKSYHFSMSHIILNIFFNVLNRLLSYIIIFQLLYSHHIKYSNHPNITRSEVNSISSKFHTHSHSQSILSLNARSKVIIER
jgi:hypothetical protein